MKTKFFIIIVVLAVACWAPAASAITYSFFNITNNNADDVATAGQYLVDVTAAGAQVQFIFTNSGPAASSIADIYFDDGSLLGIANIINGPGVSFSQGASPANLPGGNAIFPQFETTVGFLADSDSPVQPNGVNPGEFVKIVFDLKGGQSFADVLDELSNRDLRIGIHVQGFAGDGSESFINNGIVPIPPTALLLGSGLLGLGLLGWRRKKK